MGIARSINGCFLALSMFVMNFLVITARRCGGRVGNTAKRQCRWTMLGLWLSIAGSAIAGVPFTPTDPTQVLERLPLKAADPRLRELQALRDQLTTQPDDLRLALTLAYRNLVIGRAEGDPRYYGYARAALMPWWHQNPPPVEVLVLRAVLRQNQHDFDGALADLRDVLALQPHHAQAWLTRAVIYQVRGEPAEALQSCLALRRLVSPLLFNACVSGTLSRNGQAEFAYINLQRVIASTDTAHVEERLWAMTLLAEIAQQRGDAAAAETHFRAALALGQRDLYLLSAYADFLLAQDRPVEVRELLKDEQRADHLLLRLALAEQRLHDPVWQRHAELLEARFAAANERGESTHIATEARLRLELRQQPQVALTLAQRNWAQGQREPQDLRLLLAAAVAARLDPVIAIRS
jgi:Tfp pilus assembly protein PilF